MTEIKFAMSVDIDDPKAVRACAAFFAALAEGETSEKPAAKPRLKRAKYESAEDFEKRKVTGLSLEDYSKMKEEVKNTQDAAAENVAEMVETEQKKEVENTSGITIDQVRKMVQEKAKDHKTAMVAKLKEYGVPNVTKLGPAHYEEFMTFLKALD